MRIKISLLPLDDPASLPLDHYPLAALLYQTVALTAPDYAELLHEQGYRGADAAGAPFKFFVFSKPYLPDTLLDKGRDEHVWFRGGAVTWQVAAPEEAFIAALVNGLRAQPIIVLGDARARTRYVVTRIEEVLPPRFTNQMRFTTLSPLTVAVREADRREKQFLRADDPRFGPQVCANLCHKFRVWTGAEPPAEGLGFAFDADYLKRRGGVGRISRLESYKGTQIKSWQAPFVMSGDPRLLQLGWECGFGEANSKGFGMAQAVSGKSETRLLWAGAWEESGEGSWPGHGAFSARAKPG